LLVTCLSWLLLLLPLLLLLYHGRWPVSGSNGCDC
jgi:hypothetical protein